MSIKNPELSLTPQTGAIEPSGVTFDWPRRPTEAEPGEVVVGSKASVRRYAAALTPGGAELTWADGRDHRTYQVERDWLGRWACTCPAWRKSAAGVCKHTRAVSCLFETEGW